MSPTEITIKIAIKALELVVIACIMAKERLSINDLEEVVVLILRHKFPLNSYEKLGSELSLSSSTMDKIKVQYWADANKALKECLTKWLLRADDVHHFGPSPSIPSLIKALRNIGENVTADGICHEKHDACKIFQDHKLSLNQLVLDAMPQIAVLLNSEGLIEGIPTGEAAKMLSAVKESVCADHPNLCKFAAILQKLESTATTGASIMKNYRKLFCEEIVQNEKDPSDKSSVRKNISTLQVHECVKLRRRFANAVTDACLAMLGKIPPENLKEYLHGSYGYLNPQLVHLSTTDDMLDLICDQCSPIDIDPLGKVAYHFQVKSGIDIIEKYKKSVPESLRGFLGEEMFPGSASLKCETITFVVDGDVDDWTLEDVKHLIILAFQKEAPNVKIQVIKESNSFLIICSFPLSLSEKLIAAATRNIEALKDKRVKKLTIGHCTMYQQETTRLQTRNVMTHGEAGHLDADEIQSKDLKSNFQLLLLQNVQLLSQKMMEEQKKKLQIQRPSPIKQSPLVFEDDIYGSIVIDHPLIIKIVKTSQFQRLKDIKKLGYVYHNIPRALYTRLQHSIGLYFLAGKFVKKLKKEQPYLNITESDVLCVQIAALCSNLGFGPFSHIFNELFHDILTSKEQWKNYSAASVEMFQHMIDVNTLPFHEYFDDPETEIKFIKELMTRVKTPQAGRSKEKAFLYEIIFNKTSGLDTYRFDYTTRDAPIIGKTVPLKWKVFLSKLCVREFPDGSNHICATNENDLDTFNGIFALRHALFKELYFERKNRIVVTMVNQILVKCRNEKLIRAANGERLPIIEATKSMDTYSRLNDGILNVIKEQVDNPEVQELIDRLHSSKLFIPIGLVKDYERHPQDLKADIIKHSGPNEIEEDDIIVDPIKSGFEESKESFMYYVNSAGQVREWTKEWRSPPPDVVPSLWCVFFTKRDKALVESVKRGFMRMTEEVISGEMYEGDTDPDLLPDETAWSVLQQV